MTIKLRVAAVCAAAALALLSGCASSGESAAFSNQQQAQSPAAEEQAVSSEAQAPDSGKAESDADELEQQSADAVQADSSASGDSDIASSAAEPSAAPDEASPEAAQPSETGVLSEFDEDSPSSSAETNAATPSDYDVASSDSASTSSDAASQGDVSTASASSSEEADPASLSPAASGASAHADASASAASPAPAENSRASDSLPDFPSWYADSTALADLVSYVESVTNETSPDYIEPKDRIATFDFDGTLFSEKDPVYIDYSLLLYRVLDDPTYEAPEPTRMACESIREYANQGVISPDYGQIKNDAFAQAFAGMTSNEFDDYVNGFLDEQALGFDGMTYGEAFYKPMVELVNYLNKNDFNIYIVSTCERETVRAIVCDRLGIEPDHVIGSDLGTSATGQSGAAPESYTFEQDDQLVMDGTVLTENANMHKVVTIEREIGKRPVLAFGNSTGDFAMLNYAAANDEHKGKAFLVIADDTEREYGDVSKARDMKASAKDEGWAAFSMRDDWKTVYGSGVSKTQLPLQEVAS